jgi:cytochrome c553|tara:strand:- start:594 stop:1031 length:438 start_codon:yes stop_codon:yes gene_type:complete
MKGYIFTICVSLLATIAVAYNGLEYKGGKRNTACYGECYEEYVKTYGTVIEIEQRKQALANADEFSSIRSLWAGCAACHGADGGGMGPFPRLAGQNADYIYQRLQQYKNRETVGSMSSTMWAQAGMLSDNDMKTIGAFIEAGLPQ